MSNFKWLDCIQELTNKRMLLKRQANSDTSIFSKKHILVKKEISDFASDSYCRIGPHSQVATYTSSSSVESEHTTCSSEKMQQDWDFSNNTTLIPAHAIKKEILDPSDENQELILPDFPQHTTSTHAMNVDGTAILDSYGCNQNLLPNIKVEPTETDQTIEELSEGILNSESGNSVPCNYQLKKCFVLLQDCMIPKILATTSNLKYNKTFSDIPELYPLSEEPFYTHISDYEKIAVKTINRKKKILPCKMSFFKPKKLKRKNTFSKTIPEIKKVSRKTVLNIKNCKPKCNCNSFPAITVGNQLDQNLSESSQQLCMCVTSDFRMSENTNLEKLFLFDPDFGKIPCGINKMV